MEWIMLIHSHTHIYLRKRKQAPKEKRTIRLCTNAQHVMMFNIAISQGKGKERLCWKVFQLKGQLGLNTKSYSYGIIYTVILCLLLVDLKWIH
jgi:hypothetical protein